jgi:hypothetical protein
MRPTNCPEKSGRRPQRIDLNLPLTARQPLPARVPSHRTWADRCSKSSRPVPAEPAFRSAWPVSWPASRRCRVPPLRRALPGRPATPRRGGCTDGRRRDRTGPVVEPIAPGPPARRNTYRRTATPTGWIPSSVVRLLKANSGGLNLPCSARTATPAVGSCLKMGIRRRASSVCKVTTRQDERHLSVKTSYRCATQNR